jgi:hypothetical protein
MSKAKTASKNNPTFREKPKVFSYKGREIKPVKLIQTDRSFFAAEYTDSNDLVVDNNGNILAWDKARS